MCSAPPGPCRIGGRECSLFSRSLDLPVGQQPLPSCRMRLAGRVAPPSPGRAKTGGARGTPQMVPPVPGLSPLSPLDRVTQRGAGLVRHRDVDRVGHHGEAPVRKPDRLHGRVVGVGQRHRLRGAPGQPGIRSPWPDGASALAAPRTPAMRPDPTQGPPAPVRDGQQRAPYRQAAAQGLRAIALRSSGDSGEAWSEGPLPLAAAFRQRGGLGRGGSGRGKTAPPAVGHAPRRFGLKGLAARVYFAFTYAFPPTPAPAAATWSPAPMVPIIRGSKGAGERRAGQAGPGGPCARP